MSEMAILLDPATTITSEHKAKAANAARQTALLSGQPIW